MIKDIYVKNNIFKKKGQIYEFRIIKDYCRNNVMEANSNKAKDPSQNQVKE